MEKLNLLFATNLTLDNYATVGASTLEADEYFEVALSGLTAADGYPVSNL